MSAISSPTGRLISTLPPTMMKESAPQARIDVLHRVSSAARKLNKTTSLRK
jgi:hypothetical protein